MAAKTYLADHTVTYEEVHADCPLIDIYFRLHNPCRHPIVAIPDGMNDLQFLYGPFQTKSEVVFGGTALRGRERLIPVSDWLFGVRFRPGIVPQSLSATMDKVVDLAIPVYSVPCFDRIWKAVSRERDFHEQIRLFEGMFFPWIYRPLHDITQELLQRTAHIEPYDTVDTLVAETGYSHVHVNRVFKGDMGFSLKFYLDMLRMQRVISCMETGGAGSLQALSENMGFYDQSHFIRTFKKYTTVTPKEFMKQFIITA